MGRYTKQPTDMAGSDTSCRLKKVLHKRKETKSRLMCGSLVTAKELDSGVNGLHRCFTERRFYSRRLLLGALASKAATQVTCFLGS